MSITTSAPEWRPEEWELETGIVVRWKIDFAGKDLCVFSYSPPQTGSWRFYSNALDIGAELPAAATAEEAITEAVATIAQYFAQLREELAAIPLTLPTTPTT